MRGPFIVSPRQLPYAAATLSYMHGLVTRDEWRLLLGNAQLKDRVLSLEAAHRAFALSEARYRWGGRAADHGLTIVDVGTDDSTISVNAKLFGPSFQISQQALQYARNVNWPFEEAKRYLEGR